MKIVYHSSSLFDAPRNSCLVHATNCQGKWGSGIAVEFARRFPNAYVLYHAACLAAKDSILGSSLIIRDVDYYIGCLNTSFDYGARKDPPNKIVAQTQDALAHFLNALSSGIDIYSNKFNSGFFGVPWEETEAVIENFPDKRVWNVCTGEKPVASEKV